MPLELPQRGLELISAALLLIASTISSGAESVSAPASTPGDIDQWLSLREPGYMAPITISADGKWLAVMMKGAVSEGSVDTAGLPKEVGTFEAVSADLAGSEVFIIERATGQILHPFQKYAASFSPVWAPSGETLLLAVQDSPSRLPRLATWSPGDNATHVFTAATYQPDIGFTGPAWTPDGRNIVFTFDDVTPKKRSRIEEKVIPSEDAHASKPTATKITLAVLNVESGKVRQFSGFGPYGYEGVWGFRIAPNGNSAAFLAKATPPSQEEANWVKLTTVNLETGVVQIIGDTPQADGWSMSFSWSPDCSHIAWVPTGEKENKLLIATLGDKPTICEVPLPKNIAAGRLEKSDNWPPAPPLWSADSSSFWLPGENALLHFSTDGSSLGTLTLPSGKGGSDWLECAAPSFAPVRTQAVHSSGPLYILRKREIEAVNLQAAPSPTVTSVTSVTVAAKNERAIDWATSTFFSLQKTGFRGWELMQTSFIDGKSSRLALLQPALDGVDLGTTRTLSWKLSSGEACKGTLLLPTGWKEGDKPPVVMEVYGGDDKGNGNKTPEEMTDLHLTVHPHVLAAHGYAVFKPDMPQTKAEPAASLVHSAEAALDALAASGLVDADRVALTGASYGGYTVLSVLVASQKFKVGIVANGIYDLTRSDTDTGVLSPFQWVEEGQGLMGGSLWEKQQRYIDNTPLFKLDKLQTPLLVVQGESDEQTNTQGPALYGALLRLGKPSVYLLAPGMHHAPALWTVEAQKDLIPRVLAFLDKYLRNKDGRQVPQAVR
jgi:dipeptidyl aminopeptidase/acylaminoacyl peptidase